MATSQVDIDRAFSDDEEPASGPISAIDAAFSDEEEPLFQEPPPPPPSPTEEGAEYTGRGVAKGVLGGAFELTPPVMGARILGGVFADLADSSTRFDVGEVTSDETTYPGIEGITQSQRSVQQGGHNPTDIAIQDAITQMREYATDFLVDVIPATLDDNWHPKAVGKGERIGQDVVEKYAMLPVEVVSFVPRVIGEAVAEESGDRLLGKFAELGAFSGMMSAYHTSRVSGRAQKAERLRKAQALVEEHRKSAAANLPGTWVHAASSNVEGVVFDSFADLGRPGGKQEPVVVPREGPEVNWPKVGQKIAEVEALRQEQTKQKGRRARKRAEQKPVKLATVADVVKKIEDILQDVQDYQEGKPVTKPPPQPKPKTKRETKKERKQKVAEVKAEAKAAAPPAEPAVPEGKVTPFKVEPVPEGKGWYRRSRQGGRVIGPDGRALRRRFTNSEATKFVAEQNDILKKERASKGQLPKEDQAKATRLREGMGDRSVDLIYEANYLSERGVGIQELINHVTSLFANMSEEQRANNKKRYNDLRQFLFAERERNTVIRGRISATRIAKALRDTEPPAAAPKVAPTAGALEQEGRRAAPRKKKKAETPVDEKVEVRVIEDSEHAELRKIFGEGDQVTYMDASDSPVAPYKTDVGDLRSAFLLDDGQILAGPGSATSHKVLLDWIPAEEHGFYAKNMKTHRGFVDDWGRFISLGELSAAKGDVRIAYENKFGANLPADLLEGVTPSQVKAFATVKQMFERAVEMDTSPSAEWDIVRTIEGGHEVHVVKEKGSSQIKVLIDGIEHNIKVSKTRVKTSRNFASQLLQLLESLKSEKGQSALLMDAARDFIDIVAGGKEGLETFAKQTAATFTPTSRILGPGGKYAGGVIREWNARLDRQREVLMRSFRKIEQQMDRWTDMESVEFIDAIQRGELHRIDPAIRPIAESFRKLLDLKWAEVRMVGGKNATQTVIEHYFPQYWKVKKGIVERIFGRRPIEGAKTHQKKRVYRYMKDGLNAGLQPLTYNPTTFFLWKMFEMDKFITGTRIFNDLLGSGKLEYVRSGKVPTVANFVKLEDPVARKSQKVAGGFVERGAYYAPPEIARIFHNYLKPGLHGRGILAYDIIRGTNMLINMAQLGLSAFHFTFTAVDAMNSRFSLALEEFGRGQIASGLYHFATGPIGPASQLYHGRKLGKSFYTTALQNLSPEQAKMMDALMKGGGGISREKYHDLHMRQRMLRHFRKGRPIRGLFHIPGAFFEFVTAPVMEFWVPNMKLGMFHEMALSQMKLWEKHGIVPSLEQQRIAFGDIWDSVDNRMGQIRYDNLHWNRYLKDAGMAGTRALGWNVGSISELGGAIKGVGRVGMNFASGALSWDWNKLTRDVNYATGHGFIPKKTAYGVALMAITIPMLSSIYMYMKTGELPQERKDFYYPRTGKINPDGTPERILMASYMKDVTAVYKDPILAAGHKLSPFINIMERVITNTTFEGEIIYDKDEAWNANAKRVAFEALNQFKPFSVRNFEQRRRVGESFGGSLESFFGILPAPSYVTRTTAEKKATELAQRKFGRGPITWDEMDRRITKADVYRAYLEGKPEVIDKAIEESGLTREDLKTILRRSQKPKLVLHTMSLTARDAMKVWNVCDDSEKEVLRDSMEKKIKNSPSLTRPQKLQLLQQVWE